MTREELCSCADLCVQLNVGCEVWLCTLVTEGTARLTDFRPTNEDPYKSAPLFPLMIDERLLSALRRDGRGRLIARADWLVLNELEVA